MTITRRLIAGLAAVSMLVAGGASSAAAQDTAGRGAGSRRARAAGGTGAGTMSVQQVEQYLDQVMLHQARTTLALDDDQFLRFGAALGHLQAVRRRHQRQRVTILRNLNAALERTPLDESALTAQLAALDANEARAVRETRAAYEAIDQLLTVSQRARFRVFEQAMERRKLDLIARARQQVRRTAAEQP